MEQARASRIMRFSQPHDRGGSPVPAERSSSIPSGLTALGHADPLRSAETPHLLAYLATLTGDRICAMTRFENSVLPWFGLPR
jgi:hypothetical protein